MLVFLAFGTNVFSQHYVFAQTEQVPSQLQQASTALDQAFSSVWDAEHAGANVTSLLDQLNPAANLLGQAENAYRNNDSNTAVIDANAVLPIAQQAIEDAQTTRETASVHAQTAFWSTVATTIIAAVVFVLALFLVWRWFKRNYVNRLLEARPQIKAEGSQ